MADKKIGELVEVGADFCLGLVTASASGIEASLDRLSEGRKDPNERVLVTTAGAIAEGAKTAFEKAFVSAQQMAHEFKLGTKKKRARKGGKKKKKAAGKKRAKKA